MASTDLTTPRRCHNPVMAAPLPLTVARGMLAGSAALAALGTVSIAPDAGRYTTYPGRSTAALVLFVGAGVGLVAAGAAAAADRRRRRWPDIALFAALAWFAPAYVAWGWGNGWPRSIAAVVAVFSFALVAHLALVEPRGGRARRVVRVFLAVAYVEAALVALSWALLRDPYLDPGCLANCEVDTLLVHSSPGFAHAVASAHRLFLGAAGTVVVALCVRRLATGVGRRRPLNSGAVPGVVFGAATVAWAFTVGGKVVDDPYDNGLFAVFVVTASAVLGVALTLVADVARARLERREIARIATRIDAAPAPGSLQAALASAVGDPTLSIAYLLAEPQQWVDASGAAVTEPVGSPGRITRTLTRGGHRFAVIEQSTAALDVEAVLGPAVVLSLDNERLRAEALARLAETRSSRARIVEAGDAERRRLERDLHDGAQQRLLALSYDLRLARAGADADGDTATAVRLGDAVAETQAVLGELRELARGIFPATLTEAGLGMALRTFADLAPVPVRVHADDEARYPQPVESAAYFAVVEAVADAALRDAPEVVVRVDATADTLVVTVSDSGPRPPGRLVAVEDRIGALGGEVTLEAAVRRMEVPCG